MTTRLPHLVPTTIEAIRLTIPAREALDRAGNRVVLAHGATASEPRYNVTLIRPPAGLVLCIIGRGTEQHRGLRLATEPEYPGEWPASSGGIAWHERGQLVPCPECGHTLLWCEAGYVPGWRVCLAGHAAQLAGDGRSAKRHPESDEGALACTRPLGRTEAYPMTLCTEKDCGRPARSGGLCAGHDRQARRGVPLRPLLGPHGRQGAAPLVRLGTVRVTAETAAALEHKGPSSPAAARLVLEAWATVGQTSWPATTSPPSKPHKPRRCHLGHSSHPTSPNCPCPPECACLAPAAGETSRAELEAAKLRAARHAPATPSPTCSICDGPLPLRAK